MKLSYFTRQGGVVFIQVVLALVVLLGMAALALDLGHVYVLKTRMQNMVDAAALGGAKEYDVTEGTASAKTAAAETAAENTFKKNLWDSLNNSVPGNEELRGAWDANKIDLAVAFSTTLSAGSFDPSGVGPYVKVSAEWPTVVSWFARIAGISQFEVNASAVAGPSAPLAQVCNIFPILICQYTESATPPYWGYPSPYEVDLAAKGLIGPGNFGFLSFEDEYTKNLGASNLQEALSGRYERCIKPDDGVNTKTGEDTNKVITGVNSRFEPCAGLTPKLECGVGSDGYPVVRPDQVAGSPLTYSAYQARYAAGTWNYPPDDPIPESRGAPERRVVVVPVADCNPPITGTSVNAPVKGFACLFLREPADKELSDLKLKAELIPLANCDAQGIPGSGGGGGASQLHEIVLHDNPDSEES